MALFLYLVTALVTALPVFYALLWAVWGAGISVLEIISLLGSGLLAVAGLFSLSERRLAARIALVGLAAIWSLYLSVLVGMARMTLSDQRLTLQVVRWMPSPQALTIVDPLKDTTSRIGADDIGRLTSLSLNGIVKNEGSGVYGNGRKSSHVLVVIEHPVISAVNLPEPDGVSVIYVQRGESWEKLPPKAPTLSRTIRLQPVPGAGEPVQTLVSVELANGARPGFGVPWYDYGVTHQ